MRYEFSTLASSMKRMLGAKSNTIVYTSQEQPIVEPNGNGVQDTFGSNGVAR